jgi:hypothetical protein
VGRQQYPFSHRRASSPQEERQCDCRSLFLTLFFRVCGSGSTNYGFHVGNAQQRSAPRSKLDRLPRLSPALMLIPIQNLFPYSTALVVSQLAYALVDICAILGFKVVHRTFTKSASATFGILSLFFQACVFAFICLVAQTNSLEGGRLGSVDDGTKTKKTGPRWSRKFSI